MCDMLIHLLRIVEVGAGTRAAGNRKNAMQRLGAVVAC